MQVGKIHIISREDFGEYLKENKSRKKHGKENQTTLEF
jgi:hypothetical protein